MKIGIVFTGGTIGSRLGDNGYIAPDKSSPFKLIDIYRENIKNRTKSVKGHDNQDNVEFVISEAYEILSEMLDAKHLLKLIGHVTGLLRTDLDGIIVTHGTDTLQYSAAMLSYALGTASIPVVLVSADYPLEDARSNGLANFDAAVEFIRQRAGSGVFVSYKNKGDDFVLMHRGTRVLAHMAYSASVFSVYNQYYAKYNGIDFEINRDYVKSPNEKVGDDNTDVLRPNENTFAEASGHIQRVFAYPGMEYQEASDGIKAVLFESYHSGTLCMDEKFAEYANGLAKRGAVMFIAGADIRNTQYETASSYSDLNLTVLPAMSPVAAYCKLWLLLSNKRSLDDMMINMAEDFV